MKFFIQNPTRRWSLTYPFAAVLIMLLFQFSPHRVYCQTVDFEIIQPSANVGVAEVRLRFAGTAYNGLVKKVDFTVTIIGASDLCLQDGIIGPNFGPTGDGTCASGYKIEKVAGVDNKMRIYRECTGTNTFTFTAPTGSNPVMLRVPFRAGPVGPVTASVAGTITRPSLPAGNFSATSGPINMPLNLSVSGAVKRWPTYGGAGCLGFGQYIQDVTMSLTPDPDPTCFPGYISDEVTQFTYNFSTNVPPYFSYVLTPYKDGGCPCGAYAPGQTGTFTQHDIDMGRSWILGTWPTGPTNDKPYNGALVGADMVDNGMITTYDLAVISKCQLGLSIDDAGSPWIFVPDTELGNLNQLIPANVPGVPSYPSTISLTNITMSPVGKSFYGFRRGDVDRSCTDCAGMLVAPPEDRGQEPVQHLLFTDRPVQKGQDFVLPLSLNKTKGIAVFDFELLFNPEYVEVLGAETVDVPGEFGQYSLLPEEGQMVLRYGWFSAQRGGVDLEEGGTLVNVKLRAKKSAASVSEFVSQRANPNYNRLSYEDGAAHANLWFASPTANSTFEAKWMGENPSGRTTGEIWLNVPEAGEVWITLTNAQGQVIKQQKRILETGAQIWGIEGLDNPGLYTVTIQSIFRKEVIKVVKI